MNKRILPLFAISALAAFAQNPTVTSVSYSDLSHSTLLVHMQISSGWQNVRIRYIPTAQGSCLSGTGGSVQPSGYPRYGGATLFPFSLFIIPPGPSPDTPN